MVKDHLKVIAFTEADSSAVAIVKMIVHLIGVPTLLSEPCTMFISYVFFPRLPVIDVADRFYKDHLITRYKRKVLKNRILFFNTYIL